MEEIDIADFTGWLTKSEKYLSHINEGFESIIFPKEYYTETDNIENIDDFIKVNEMCKYWVIESDKIYDYLINNSLTVIRDLFGRIPIDEYFKYMEYIVKEQNRIIKYQDKIIDKMNPTFKMYSDFQVYHSTGVSEGEIYVVFESKI